MRRRAWLAMIVIIVSWVSLAVTRQQLTASSAERSLGITRHHSFSGTVAPHERVVLVPLVPLLLDPFQSHPKAYLMDGDFPIAEIRG